MIVLIGTLIILLATLVLVTLARRKRFFAFAVYFIGSLLVGALLPFIGIVKSLDFQLFLNELYGGAELASIISSIFSAIVIIFLIVSAITLIAFAEEISTSIEIRLNKPRVFLRHFEKKYTYSDNTNYTNIRICLARLNC